jgi:hypothetical protein
MGPGASSPAIGTEMFRRFKVTFDAAHGVPYLEPNRHIVISMTHFHHRRHKGGVRARDSRWLLEQVEYSV